MAYTRTEIVAADRKNLHVRSRRGYLASRAMSDARDIRALLFLKSWSIESEQRVTFVGLPADVRTELRAMRWTRSAPSRWWAD